MFTQNIRKSSYGNSRSIELINAENMKHSQVFLIVEKIEYDPLSNQIVVLLLSTTSTTGMSTTFSFLAESATGI